MKVYNDVVVDDNNNDDDVVVVDDDILAQTEISFCPFKALALLNLISVFNGQPFQKYSENPDSVIIFLPAGSP